MSIVTIRRPPRRSGPAMPSGEILLESPPKLPQETPDSALLMTMLPSIVALAGVAVIFAIPASGGVTYVAGALVGIAALGQLVNQMGRPVDRAGRTLDADRRRYLRYLASVRRRVRKAAEQQSASQRWRHPEPAALWSFAGGKRMWERRSHDDDFGHVRIGTGPQRLAVDLITPETGPVEDLEPMSAAAMRRFVAAHAVVPDLPVSLSLRAFSRVVVAGPRPDCLDLVRAMLCAAAVLHSPEDLRILVVTSPDRRADWDWVKWLPHTGALPVGSRGQGIFHTDVTAAESELGGLLPGRPRFSPSAKELTSEPHVVLIVDGADTGRGELLAAPGLLGTTVVDLSGRVPKDVGRWLLKLSVSDTKLTVDQGTRTTTIGSPDQLSEPQARAVARSLAPYRMPGPAESDIPLFDSDASDLLGLSDLASFDIERAWRERPPADRLRVLLGTGPTGQPVEIDLKESAQGGHGPHGLLVGATGSGKSELLRTIVASLVLRHSPADLNLVLVDFKGGATFTSLDQLPHTSAVITNLAEDLGLVERMQQALGGELLRRQELLRASGNYVSQRDYEMARRAGEALPPLPSLLIIVDEFSELLSAKPDFIETFVQIGRVGRSLGVHLLLASQRLEEGRLRGLDTHLSYRIGLRTFSAAESRMVLGVPDAYELPSAPGHGYLRYGTEPLRRFRAAYVSGPYPPRRTSRAAVALPAEVDGFVVVGRRPLLEASGPADLTPTPDDLRPSLLEAIGARVAGQGSHAHQIWLPPLSTPPTLTQLLPPLHADAERGLHAPAWPGNGRFQVPVGIVDLPFEQRREPLLVDLAGATGNAAVVGTARSGKSTLTRTLVAALALTHTPREARFYCLDFGGSGLSALAELPHVSCVVDRRDPDQVRRVVAHVKNVLERREASFAAEGIDSIETYRRRHTGDSGDIFLVIDGWGTLCKDFDDLEAAVTGIARGGLGFGVHVLVTANRWVELRAGIRDFFGSRLELRLGDPVDSEINRRVARDVPATPGRGLASGGAHFLAAVAQGGDLVGAPSAEATRDLVKTIANAWPGPPAPRLDPMPARLTAAALVALAANDSRGLPVGLDVYRHEPVVLDFVQDPHLLVFGDGESGKTNLLRLVVQSLVNRYPPAQVRLVIIDYRRGLLDAVSGEHLLAYAPSASVATEIVSFVNEAIKGRLPGPDITPDQVRNRSWWHGPELFVVVDDYDLVSSGATNPLAPLAPLVPQAVDIGLHLIVARRAAGTSRALYERLLQTMVEVDTPTLLMSGRPEEGPMLGNRRFDRLPPGRGWLVRRREADRLVQTAMADPGVALTEPDES
ncbi:type VII secretion protein EccCa [Asanoa sp. WMMD1127]|uniref:type VII secretion protein EccCa n=1 Tax=Asanoa sp. WMMD1127 TaxID=3016107 RepID=UPI002415DE06|nr:type VII secretion protein EccCa [Asanoa sp. WMMD1127]MDG4825055.1 type VII secretion protein EccCa [Asanoa sp. WMMD1127]